MSRKVNEISQKGTLSDGVNHEQMNFNASFDFLHGGLEARWPE